MHGTDLHHDWIHNPERKRAAQQEQRDRQAATRAQYAPTGPHEMPQEHLPAGVTDPTSWDRPAWLDNIESGDFPGIELPLEYAPTAVQEARTRMVQLHEKLTTVDEAAKIRCEEYREQGDDVKAALKAAALEGNDPGDAAKKVEAKRKATATKYHDAVLKRDAFLEALGEVYALVVSETEKGLPAWHDAMQTARLKRMADTIPALSQFMTEHGPAVAEALSLLGSVEAARGLLKPEGVLIAGAAPVVPSEKLSGAYSGFALLSELWVAAARDGWMTADAETFRKAHVVRPTVDYSNRAATVEALMEQGYTREEAEEATRPKTMTNAESDAALLKALNIGGDPNGNAMEGKHLDPVSGEWFDG
ncbi:hypothetical protein [Streptomyces formicae]